MLCACNEENVSSSSINSSKLTVNDAKTFFETTNKNNILQKSMSRGINTEEEDIPEFTGLTPVNFTPIWNNAVVTVNEKACFVNIPIVTLEKYHVQGKSSKNMISLAQKMVVSQKATGEMICQVVTLLPENGKSSESQINSFNLSQKDTEYSGIVIYTTLGGILTQIERYETGKVIETTRISEENHEGETMNNLLEEYDFFKNDAISMYSSSEGGGGGSTGPYPFCTYCGKMLRYCDCTHHNNPNKSYKDCPICFPNNPKPGTCAICGHLMSNCTCSSDAINKYCQKCGAFRNFVNRKCSVCGYTN